MENKKYRCRPAVFFRVAWLEIVLIAQGKNQVRVHSEIRLVGIDLVEFFYCVIAVFGHKVERISTTSTHRSDCLLVCDRAVLQQSSSG
jgi:hypothetical protein